MTQPDFLFITTDQQRGDCVGYDGTLENLHRRIVPEDYANVLGWMGA